MAPGPDNQQEPMAPDRIDENLLLSEIVTTANVTAVTATAPSADIIAPTAAPPSPIADAPATNSVAANNNNLAVSTLPDDIIVNSTSSSADNGESNSNQNAPNASGDDKQEDVAKFSNLNEGQLKALLDEAFTYKSPKDREGKSNLFKELLQEVEADETEEGRRIVASSRCIPGSNRRRHKRDSVSEQLTHGGSLQNLAQPINSEFDSSFAYLTSGSSHTYGSGRRKGKKHTGPSVSARQREGGSLPSNVNASHSLASLANLDLLFDKKKRFSEDRSAYDWTNKEKSKSLDKPTYGCGKKEEKEKKELTKRENSVVTPSEQELESRDKKSVKGKSVTNEMPESDNSPPKCKRNCMVIDFDFKVNTIGDRNAISSTGGSQRPQSVEIDDDEGTEMKIIESRRKIQEVISLGNYGPGQTPVDAAIEFSIHEQTATQTDKSKALQSVNGTESTVATPIQTYNSVKCVVSGTVNLTSTPQGKVISSSLYSVMPVPWTSPNIAMETVSRLTAQHIPSGEKKSLDENGNAVQGHNGERKKSRRKQEPNVIVYKAENVEGHRTVEDIDTIIQYIENKESKGKKGKASNAVRVKTTSATKSRTRDKDSKREQLPAKLQKSNSLEEISKTKLEDLTAEKSTCSSGASSISSQHGAINVALRRAKQLSTGDSTVDSRGDRRSWGTEEGQSIYCNATGDDYATRRNSTKKMNAEVETETEFLVVQKKKKSKKQRRSSSGGRAQNLSNAGSYLQRSGGFSNDYRTPLSPELRRKSTSSMPPSDKSDSSDLDSVHSLPVTSNSSKHNSTKNGVSSGGGAPQVSYADIARTATINMPHSSVLNISTMVPNMLNAGTWPPVPVKSPSEPDKFPQDYYPSLDELQQADRKIRQHNFAHTNHVQSLNLSFEKPPSPTLAKTKTTPEAKKAAEAREEAINKNIQVFKYVQDVEKKHQSMSNSQEQPIKIGNPVNVTSNNPSNCDNIVNNPSSPKFNSLPIIPNSNNTNNNSNNNNNSVAETEINNPIHENANPTKDANATTRINYNRTRRNYQQTVQNNNQETPSQRDGKIAGPVNATMDERDKNTSIITSNCHQDDNKDTKKSSNLSNNSSSSSSSQDEMDKPKLPSQSAKTNSLPRVQTASGYSDTEASSRSNTKTERLSRASKDQQGNPGKLENAKVGNVQSAKSDRTDRSVEVKRAPVKQQQNSSSKIDKETQKTAGSESQQSANKRSSNLAPRPAVILLDENSSDVTRNSGSPSELTFGFEVNEQLLLSEEANDDNQDEDSPLFVNQTVIFNKPPPNYERPPPIFDKHVRYKKFPPNFPIHPAHMQHHHPHHHHHHGIPPPHTQPMITPIPYMGYPPRFQSLPAFQQPPPQPSSIIEKYNHHHHHPHQPKEDFSARYVAPEETVNVHNYNHDKIVTFVGLAWDAVMREIPATTTTGRVQYYKGQ